jgi:hypothetical protein
MTRRCVPLLALSLVVACAGARPPAAASRATKTDVARAAPAQSAASAPDRHPSANVPQATSAEPPVGTSGPYSLAAFKKVIDYALKHPAKP